MNEIGSMLTKRDLKLKDARQKAGYDNMTADQKAEFDLKELNLMRLLDFSQELQYSKN